MSLLFVIFGLKRRTKQFGACYPSHCINCRNNEYLHLQKERKWFHIFWIPLIPWTAAWYLVCPRCGLSVRLVKQEAKEAKTLQQKLESTLLKTDDEYGEAYDAVADFERSVDLGPNADRDNSELVATPEQTLEAKSHYAETDEPDEIRGIQ